MKKPTIFHALIFSFGSRDLYREVARNWRGMSFLYLLVMLAVCWIPGIITAYVGLSHFVKEEAPKLVAQVPAITISHGKVSTDADEPCHIRDPETGKVIAIIDTTGQVTSLDETDALALLTQDRLLIKKEHETTVYDLSTVESFSVDGPTIDVWLGRIVVWGPIVAFPFLLLGSYVYRIVQAFIYAVIGLLVKAIAGASLGYPAILSMAMVAVTPAVALKTFMGIVGVDLPFAWLLYFAVAMGYLYFAISSCSTPEETEATVRPPDSGDTSRQ